MVYLVSNLPAANESVILRAMFMARKRGFVDLLCWDVPVVGGLYEVDPFDPPDASYIVLAEGDGRHRASARLLPSGKPHILGSLYSDLCEGPLPSGPSIREITRFCLDPRFRAKERRAARGQLILRRLPPLLWGTASPTTPGFRKLSGLSRSWASDGDTRVLGQLRNIGGTPLGALLIEIDEETSDVLGNRPDFGELHDVAPNFVARLQVLIPRRRHDGRPGHWLGDRPHPAIDLADQRRS